MNTQTMVWYHISIHRCHITVKSARKKCRCALAFWGGGGVRCSHPKSEKTATEVRPRTKFGSRLKRHVPEGRADSRVCRGQFACRGTVPEECGRTGLRTTPAVPPLTLTAPSIVAILTSRTNEELPTRRQSACARCIYAFKLLLDSRWKWIKLSVKINISIVSEYVCMFS